MCSESSPTTNCTLIASAQSRNEEARMGPRVLLPPTKRAQAFHLTCLKTRGAPTTMSVTYKKQPDYSFPVRVLCTYTNHSVNLSNPPPASFLGHLCLPTANISEAGFYFNLSFFLFPPEHLQRQAGWRLFRVRKIALIMTTVGFKRRKRERNMVTSTKMI